MNTRTSALTFVTGLAFAAMLVAAATSHAAVLLDTTTSNFQSTASLTTPVTVGNNAARMLLIGVSDRDTQNNGSDNRAVTGITYAGDNISGNFLGQITNADAAGRKAYTRLYYVLAPGVGTNHLVVNFSNSTGSQVNVVSLYNVDQSAPSIFDFVSQDAITTDLTLNSTSPDAAMVSFATRKSGFTVTPTLTGPTGTVTLGTWDQGNTEGGFGWTPLSSTGSKTHSWNSGNATASEWAIGGVIVNPIPEPGSMALLAAGGLFMVLRGRRSV